MRASWRGSRNQSKFTTERKHCDRRREVCGAPGLARSITSPPRGLEPSSRSTKLGALTTESEMDDDDFDSFPAGWMMAWTWTRRLARIGYGTSVPVPARISQKKQGAIQRIVGFVFLRRINPNPEERRESSGVFGC